MLKRFYFKDRLVDNFWHCLSHAIGSSWSSLVVWNALIWAHAPIRFIISWRLYKAYEMMYDRLNAANAVGENVEIKIACVPYKIMLYLAYNINNLEIVCLLGLSGITSNSPYGIY